MKPALLIAACAVIAARPQDDPTEIVRRSVARDTYNFENLRNYTFEQRIEGRRYGRGGELTKKESETYEILILGGRPYQRLVARDDQPLSDKDARKEQQKLDKELAKRQRESASDKKDAEKERIEDRRIIREVPEAFLLSLRGVENVNGRPAWMVDAVPKPGYRAKVKRAGLLSKVRGRIWIDQADYQWVKVDVEVIDTISFGLGLLRIAPGGGFHLEQVRVNDEIWLPSRLSIRGDARLGFVRKLHAEADVTYRDYKKFQAESRVVETAQ